MPRLQSGGQQTESRDQRKADIVLHRHELGLGFLIQSRNRILIGRVDLLDLRVFVNDLRLVIAHLVDLVRDLIKIFSPNDDANQLLATYSKYVPFDRFTSPPLIRKSN